MKEPTARHSLLLLLLLLLVVPLALVSSLVLLMLFFSSSVWLTADTSQTAAAYTRENRKKMYLDIARVSGRSEFPGESSREKTPEEHREEEKKEKKSEQRNDGEGVGERPGVHFLYSYSLFFFVYTSPTERKGDREMSARAMRHRANKQESPIQSTYSSKQIEREREEDRGERARVFLVP